MALCNTCGAEETPTREKTTGLVVKDVPVATTMAAAPAQQDNSFDAARIRMIERVLKSRGGKYAFAQ